MEQTFKNRVRVLHTLECSYTYKDLSDPWNDQPGTTPNFSLNEQIIVPKTDNIEIHIPNIANITSDTK